MIRSAFILIIIQLFVIAGTLYSQPRLQKDYSFVMEIPGIIAMESSPAHLYILSRTEGMVVFRTQPEDTLQWLYSSTGMEQRGNTMTADIRFAYLYGLNRRLTVLEPTSVLGVYSSTLLNEKPLDAKRLRFSLYIALGSGGLGKVSLKTPASVDSAVSYPEREKLANAGIIDLETAPGQLFALSSTGQLFLFKQNDDGISLENKFDLERSITGIFVVRKNLYGTDNTGNIYEIDNSGNLATLGTIGEPVQKIESWNEWLFIKGQSNKVWYSFKNRSPELWKDDEKAGNYLTVTKDNLWLSEYNQVSRIITATGGNDLTGTTADLDVPQTMNEIPLKLMPVEGVTVPYPRPVLRTIQLDNNYPMDNVQFTYQSNIEDAQIQGNGFYWQPDANDVGTHRFKIIATASDGQADSTSFDVEVRSFNAPPRFTPIRPITIPADESFTLPIKALDPDGMNRDLVRYLGVDLPEGASVNENTGIFQWTPTLRQTGENTFKVIATDQYGAASSVNITIRVIDTVRDGN